MTDTPNDCPIADMPEMTLEESQAFINQLRRLHPSDLLIAIGVAGAIICRVHDHSLIAHRGHRHAFIFGVNECRGLVSDLITTIQEA